MPNIIAKKINLAIDTIDSKPIRLKDNFVIGDSIELSISLTENKVPKDITGARIRLLVSNEGVFEQVNNIEISDATKGLIKIQLEPHMINKLNMNLYQIVIEDLDENINCQKFIVNVIDSLATQVILEAQDGLSTLARLNQEIDNYTVALNDIKQHVSDISKEVDIELVGISDKLEIISGDVDNLNNKLNNTSDAIDRLPKIIDLIPTQIQGSSIWYFSTPTIKTSPLDLVKCAYDILVVGKCLNDSTVQTATIRLQFQRINNSNGVPTIKVNTSTICDFSVQGRTVNASVVFDNMSDTINASATNYKLYIKSNVLVSLNFQSEIYSSMSSLGRNLDF